MFTNSITLIDTPTSTSHLYLDQITIFTSSDLCHLIFPGLFHELKQHNTTHRDFMTSISSTSRYKLPSSIDPDLLLTQLRQQTSLTLLFIHSWMKLHPDISSDFLNSTFDNYPDFFDSSLDLIICYEIDCTIRNKALDIKLEISKLYKYFGVYHGDFSWIIFNINDLMLLLVIIFIASMQPK